MFCRDGWKLFGLFFVVSLVVFSWSGVAPQLLGQFSGDGDVTGFVTSGSSSGSDGGLSEGVVVDDDGSVKVDLKSGWNLVSVPFRDFSVTGCDSEDDVVLAIHYDSVKSDYGDWIAREDFVSEVGLRGGLGYWVYYESEESDLCSLSFSGSVPVLFSDIGDNLDGALSSGVNMVGGTGQGVKLSDYAGDCKFDKSSLMWFDPERPIFVLKQAVDENGAVLKYYEKVVDENGNKVSADVYKTIISELGEPQLADEGVISYDYYYQVYLDEEDGSILRGDYSYETELTSGNGYWIRNNAETNCKLSKVEQKNPNLYMIFQQTNESGSAYAINTLYKSVILTVDENNNVLSSYDYSLTKKSSAISSFSPPIISVIPTEKGTFLISDYSLGEVREIDSSGKLIWNFSKNFGVRSLSSSYNINNFIHLYPLFAYRLKNGNTIITSAPDPSEKSFSASGKVLEVLPSGEVLNYYKLSYRSSFADGGLYPQMAWKTEDDHIFVLSYTKSSLYTPRNVVKFDEYNSTGSSIWTVYPEQKDFATLTGLDPGSIVAAYPKGEDLYVLGSDATKMGNGKVVKISGYRSVDGNTAPPAKATVLAEGLNGYYIPNTFLPIDDNTLLVADTFKGRVYKIDIPSGKVTWSYESSRYKEYNSLSEGNTEEFSLGCAKNLIDKEPCAPQSIYPLSPVFSAFDKNTEPTVKGVPSQPSTENLLISGTTKLYDNGYSRIFETDDKNRIVNEFKLNGLKRIQHAQRLTNGNTLLVDDSGSRVLEIDKGSRIVWQYNGTSKTERLSYPSYAERLDSGNTLIADTSNHRVIELNPEREIIWQYGTIGVSGNAEYSTSDTPLTANAILTTNEINSLTGNAVIATAKGQLNRPAFATRLENGNTLISDSENDRVIEVTPDKKIVWSYETKESGLGGYDSYRPWGIQQLPDGHILISYGSYILEVDKDKKIVWSYGTGKTGFNYNQGGSSAVRLSNGNILAISSGRVIEIDHDTKLVVRKIDPLTRDKALYDLNLKRDSTQVVGFSSVQLLDNNYDPGYTPKDLLYDGLVLLFNFEDSSLGDGLKVVDSASKFNYGMPVNNKAFYGTVHTSRSSVSDSGKIGNSASFDGAGDYMEVADNADSYLRGYNRSIAMWCYIAEITTTSCYVNKYTDFQLYYNSDNKFYFTPRAWSGYSLSSATVNSNKITEPGWYHVVAVQRGQGSGVIKADNGLEIYVNGLKEGFVSAAVTPVNHYNLFIGITGQLENKNANKKFYPGKIDELAIWNRALTSEEVKRLYDQGTVK